MLNMVGSIYLFGGLRLAFCAASHFVAAAVGPSAVLIARLVGIKAAALGSRARRSPSC
jgi:hypothetical protein